MNTVGIVSLIYPVYQPTRVPLLFLDSIRQSLITFKHVTKEIMTKITFDVLSVIVRDPKNMADLKVNDQGGLNH